MKMRKLFATAVVFLSLTGGAAFIPSAPATALGVTNPNIPGNRDWISSARKCVYWPSGITGYWPNYAPEYAPRWEVKILTTLKVRNTVLGPATDHHDIMAANWVGIAGVTGNRYPQQLPWYGVNGGYPASYWSFTVKDFFPGAAEPAILFDWQPVSYDGQWDPYYYKVTDITGGWTTCMTNRTAWLTGTAPW
jgi:hypothetical protein